MAVESEINTEKKLSLNTSQGKASKIRVSGISSSISLNFDEEETNLDLPKVPSFSGRNVQQPNKNQAEHAKSEYNKTRLLIQQELGNDISNPRLDLEIYLRSNSQLSMIKQSAVYQKLEKDEPKIAKYYVMAIALAAQTYKSLSDRKTPDLDKWAKKIVNSQMSKFYSQDNNQSQNMEHKQTRRRGLHL